MPRLSSDQWNELLEDYWEAKDANSPTSVIVLAGKYGVTPAAVYYRLNNYGRRVPIDSFAKIYLEYTRGTSVAELARLHMWNYDTLLKRIRRQERIVNFK